MSTTTTYEVSPDSTPQKKMEQNDRSPLINRSDPVAESGFFDGILRPCVAEFVATTLFVYIGTMSVQSASTMEVAIAHGFTIALLVAATGAISGGHINPAVTLGVYLSGSIPTLKAILYVISQLVGGILGAALTRGTLSETVYKAIDGGAQDLGDSTTAGQGLLCEVLLTSVLVSTVLLSAVDEGSKSSLAPIAIGFAVTADILAGANVTGASMNPARSFGPAIAVSTYNSDIWAYHWIYWVGPALGALLASVLYRLFLASPESRLVASESN